MPASAYLSGLVLRVRDTERMSPFYTGMLGLRSDPGDPNRLVAAERGFVLEWQHEPSAPIRPPGAVGLYHFALLLPDRAPLAAIARRVLDAGWPIEGASDHGVSEALYLRDPEGNGIELYRDRARDLWPVRNGDLQMVTRALDVQGLLRESRTSAPLDPRTRLGHIHLHTDDLRSGESFYAGALGLRVTQRGYPGALFLAAGDYHHHVGLNVWGSRRHAPEGATGLVKYAWRVPPGTLEDLLAHLGSLEIARRSVDNGVVLVDPSGVEVEVSEV